QVVIRPEPGGKLTSAKALYNSIRGPIETEWSIGEDRAFSLRVSIPANTRAEVRLPAEDAATVLESGQPVAEAPGVLFVRMDEGRAVYAIGSGEYRFTSRLPD